MLLDRKKKKKGGSVLSDLTALTVPFGLIAAKDTLEKFIANREKELKRFQKNQRAQSAKASSKPQEKKKPSTKPPKKSKK